MTSSVTSPPSSPASRRPPRMPLPALPSDDVSLQPPPTMPRPSGGRFQQMSQMLMHLPMMLGFGGISLLTTAQRGGPMLIVFGGIFGVMIVGMLAMMLLGGGLSKKAQVNDERRDYLRYLNNVRADVQAAAAAQRQRLLLQHPDPAGLASTAVSARLWERRRTDPDFGQVRVATGPQRLTTRLRTPQTPPLDDLDPVSATALRQFIRTYATVPDLPVALALCGYPRVGVHGQRALVLDLVRAVIAQLATFHSPDDVRIAVCVSPDAAADWQWLKWLPHSLHLTASDAAGPMRLAADDLGELAEVLGEELGQRPRFSKNATAAMDQPHVVVVRDGGSGDPDTALADVTGLLGVTVIDVGERPGPVGTYGLDLIVEAERMGLSGPDGVGLVGRPDRLDPATAEALARSLSPLHAVRPAAGDDDQPLTGSLGLADLLGIGDPRHLDVAETWRPRSRRGRLRVPLGLDASGRPLELDVKESAEEGMGPHGLVIGATGSGKSELLRTLVLALAATHSSEILNFVLVDFKGGATFAGLGALPHTSAVITNLADDLGLVGRMKDALEGELIRRQEELRAASQDSVRDYERAREAGADLKPLPSLLVIIDEFSELLSSQPDFIDTFVMIGRLGRSLGVHLMLASQRLEEGRLRGLDSHLSYRIGLRTFSSSESRSVLGVTDAADLPPIPGSGFLRTDAATLIRFKAAYVSGAAPTPRSVAPDDVRTVAPALRVLPFGLARQDPPPEADGELTVEDVLRAAAPPPAEAADASPFAETILDVMVDRLRGRGPDAHQVWLPPLDQAPPVADLLGPLEASSERGLRATVWPGAGKLHVPVGLIDKPYEQRQDLLAVDLSGAAGNVAVVGAPQSGKSTLLRTLVTSLALTHTPEEVQFFCLDFGGGTLGGLAGLPHVAGVATRLDPAGCSRTVAEVAGILVERERVFAEKGIDSVATFRRRRRAGEQLEKRPFGDVFLVVDGWGTLKEEFERLYDAALGLGARGLGYGVHVVLSANRWMEVRAQIRDAVGTRLELRLGDPFDSEVHRKVAATVPEGTPGRGVSKDKLHFLSALPVRAHGQAGAGDAGDGGGADGDGPDTGADAAALVEEMAAAWSHPPAPRVRMLPRLVSADEVTAAEGPSGPDDALRVPLGLGEATLEPVFWDLDADPFLLVLGDTESGKSALLRHLAHGLAERRGPDRLRLLVVDYRRSLLGELPDDHVVGYAGSEQALAGFVQQTMVTVRARIPGPDVTPEELRRRSWWNGPDLIVLVDDYDLVVTQRTNPLAPLVEALAQAKDIGVRLVVARRSGGAGRAMHDVLLQRMVDLGTAGLLLSGAKDDGAVLGGLRMSPQPPGRGVLVRRGSNTGLVQTAWRPPAHG